MKKSISISLFVFAILFIAIIVAGLLSYQNKKLASQTPIKNNGNSQVTGMTTTAISTFTLAEVGQHNQANDCWLIISNKVYDVTSYLNIHPGGASTILTYCGQEATQAFATKDMNQPHSTRATNLLDNYFVGNLKL